MFELWDLLLLHCTMSFTRCCGTTCSQSNREHRGRTPSLFRLEHWVLLSALHNTGDQQLYISSKGRSIMIKNLAYGHRCNDWDSNPHSADQKNQSLCSQLLSARPWHATKHTWCLLTGSHVYKSKGESQWQFFFVRFVIFFTYWCKGKNEFIVCG